jgi:Putative collagen-binding domain of a collagenase
MEHLPPRSFKAHDHPVSADDPGYVASRTAMGQTRRFAERMKLAAMVPRNELASTQYCLANAGVEYLVYLPKGGAVSVDLSNAEGDFAVEWHNAATGKGSKAGTIRGGARRELQAPFDGDAVLYLSKLTTKDR